MYQNQVNNTLKPLPHSIEQLPQHGLAWSGEPSDTDSVPSLIDADSSTDSDTENSSVGTFDFLKEEPLEGTHLENIFDEELGSPIKTDRELVRLISLELAHIDNRRCDSLRERYTTHIGSFLQC